MPRSAPDAATAAERRLVTVGQLAGAIAHDFNNLLTAILGYAELLLDDLPGDDPRRADVVEIQRSGERAARLTRQLLAFKRNADAPAQLLSWPSLLDEFQSLLQAAAGDRVRVEVVATRVREVSLQKADASHVAFALALLARDGMPSGGRCVLEPRETGPDQVVVLATLEPEAGPGVCDLPADRLADLEWLVTACGGTLEVTSEWPARARFAITYGVQAGTAEEEVAVAGPGAAPRRGPGGGGGGGPAAAPPPRGSHAVVLLAEDEASLRQVVRRMLERHGLTVVDAPNGAAALSLFRAPGAAFDLLITDIVMPGTSGVALARAVAAEHPGLAVLLVSGFVDTATLDLEALGTPWAFLPKPFTREQLIDAVQALLARTGRQPTQ